MHDSFVLLSGFLVRYLPFFTHKRVTINAPTHRKAWFLLREKLSMVYIASNYWSLKPGSYAPAHGEACVCLDLGLKWERGARTETLLTSRPRNIASNDRFKLGAHDRCCQHHLKEIWPGNSSTGNMVAFSFAVVGVSLKQHPKLYWF